METHLEETVSAVTNHHEDRITLMAVIDALRKHDGISAWGCHKPGCSDDTSQPVNFIAYSETKLDSCSHLLILHKGECRYFGSLSEARHMLTGEEVTLEEVFFRLTEPPDEIAAGINA